ncbi:carbohydrate-binding protein [Isoptericola sp. S6320L]|uniref:rhamnogalacturonan lyase family protein n=1 Tax=Isoptericola sp. S6320L TaxID=2926411 RepID=UPI001FF28F21|nr:carbohydrate-binding protein [Isoptericola sp. S6320L]MCK0116035.1 carbohydrate-binding protein [Isoptericola sp. S6320L]
MSRRRTTRAVLVAALSGVAFAATSVGTLTTAHADPVRYEAEAAPAVCAGTVDANHAGHSGTGFCNSDNAVGATLVVTIDAGSGGTATLGIRYANGGTTDRPADVVVDGETVGTVALGPTGAWDAWTTSTVTVPVTGGATTIRLAATSAGGLANIDYVEAEVTAAPTPSRHEAEDAPALCEGLVEANHAGHSGTGFCNTDNAVGAGVEFSVDAAAAGTTTLDVGYAHAGSSSRPGEVVVNGTSVRTAQFSATGAWTTWATERVTVELDAGVNTVRLQATGPDGLANIDYLDVTPGGSPDGGGDGAYEVEALTRGVSVRPASGGNLVSWRLLGTDDPDVAFNVYRDGQRLNSSPLTGATNYRDTGGSSGSDYSVAAVTGGTEGARSGVEARFGSGGFLDVPIDRPGSSYTANDASVGDLDGDGDYEYVVKWYPDNAKDNSQSGYTDNTIIDAYTLEGSRLWRIDLGRNIRSGAHYTQFQVYDYDGDGDAEIAMKTADGTRDGQGRVIGNAGADHRNAGGYVLSGPEFLTIFDGRTGTAVDTVDYQPPRGDVSSWGDSYGNRVDRFLAGTAYLDGTSPSMVFARGYYTRSVIWAVDFDGQDLTTRWVFDSDERGSQYRGQGAHSLSIADLDGDGRQDVVYGAMAIGSDGNPLWNSRMGHGDALHVSDLVPGRPGQEVYMPHESSSAPSSSLLGSDGTVLFQTSPDGDNGRGVAANVTTANPGAEYWSSNVSGLRNASGDTVGAKPSSANFLAWWDDDGERELLDGTHVDDYDDGRLLTASGVSTNNGTKSNPALSGDLFGDWREEVVWRTDDSSALRIYSTPYETDLRIPTLMHDPQYRVAIAWQNTGYNQPPHPSFHIGSEVSSYPWPDIHTP